MTSDLRPRRARRNVAVRPLCAALAIAFGAMVEASANDLPVPVTGAGFVTHGQATLGINGTTATIQQTTDRAILNWQSFNIGAGNAVVFNHQTGPNGVTLNRIHDADPSRIAGSLSANGQIYLINTNGIVFASGAQVNVGGLIASSLNVSDELFRTGAIFGQTTFAPSFEGTTGSIVVDTGSVLKAAEGGKVMLFAPSVENNGRIEAPGGQVILAAGQTVYLRGSNDDSLRGLIVEVATGGTATNGATGHIVANRGNVYVAGLTVNQQGRITATTSVSRNGSIHLLAKDSPRQTDPADINAIAATRTGTVTLAQGSRTEVLLDADKGTIDDSVALSRSQVRVLGRSVTVAGEIFAPAGDVTLTALLDPSNVSPSAARNASAIEVTSTARIDVSGVKNVALDMSKSQLSVELRGDELKDFPLQRNGFLRGKTVVIDVDKGTPLANVAKQIGGIQRGIQEKSAAAGSVTLYSEGDAVVRPGAVIDVSGGSWRYASGLVNTTRVVSGGKVYDIGEAPADRVYDAFASQYTVTDGRWGQTATRRVPGRLVEGYDVGKNAGSVTITAHAIALDGTLQGQSTTGFYQRESGRAPLGGRLVLADFVDAGNGATGRLHDLTLTSTGSPWTGAAGTALPEDRATTLDAGRLVANGFTRLDLSRNGTVLVDSALRLAPGGRLAVEGRDIVVGADVRVPAGTISFETVSILNEPLGAITVRPGVTLSAAGEWVNDFLLGLGAGERAPTAFVDGGSITLRSLGALRLGATGTGSTATAGVPTFLDAAGGGLVDTDGVVHGGRGGDVTLSAGNRFFANASIRGTAIGAPGALHLEAPSIVLRNGNMVASGLGHAWSTGDLAGDGTLIVPTAALTELGFGDITLQATVGDLRVVTGTQAHPLVKFLRPSGALTRLAPNGADIGSATQVSRIADVADALLRPAASLTLRHTADQASARLAIETGAVIRTDVGGNIALASRSFVYVDGRLSAPAGTVSIAMQVSTALSYESAQAIWLGPNAVLDARAASVIQIGRLGLRTGVVRDAGSVSLNAERGYVVAERGSQIDVSGMADRLDLWGGREVGYRSQRVAGAAGSIRITAAEGALLDGTLSGHAASEVPGAAAGTLELAISTLRRQDADRAFLFPMTRRRLEFVAADSTLPDGLSAGEAIPDTLNGRFRIPAARIRDGGFDSLRATSESVLLQDGDAGFDISDPASQVLPGTIAFEGNQTIDLRIGLGLEAQRLDVAGSDVTLSALTVSIGHAGDPYRTAVPAVRGAGTLSVRARGLLDLVGQVALQGASRATFRSEGDLRVSGAPDLSNQLTGSLIADHDIDFEAVQIYPTTYSRYEIRATGATVRFSAVTGTPGATYSAGGTLRVSAKTIEQGGVLRAPLGSMVLSVPDADGTLRLAAGSETSVAGDPGVVPFGHVQNGTEWVYEPVPGVLALQSAPPDKRVVLQGGTIDVQTGARVNVSGGGGLFAYEFVPGPGGSIDRLDAANAGDAFAILPTSALRFAAWDPEYHAGERSPFGRVVELASDGAAGVPSGRYVILPARYALLPGARLVTPVGADSIDMPTGVTRNLSDGAVVVAGRYGTGSLIADSRWQGFAIRGPEQIATLGEVRTYDGDSFFAKTAAAAGTELPRFAKDAGSLSILAAQSLTLSGALLTDRVAGARGASVDIASARLAILSDSATLPADAAGAIVLRTSTLRALGAESLLLGGVRTDTARGTWLRFVSTDLTIATTASDPLSAPEVVLGASGRLAIEDGSAVVASGVATGRKLHVGQVLIDTNRDGIFAATEGNVDVDGNGIIDAGDAYGGDGAIVRVTAGARTAIERAGVARAAGDVQVGAGALLAGRGIDVDATGTNRFAGRFDVASDGTLSLGASRITLGGAGEVADGLAIDGAQLGVLSRVASLTLRSYSSIDMRGDMVLGVVAADGSRDRTAGARLRDLVLDAGVLRAVRDDGTTTPARAVVAADAITFRNTQGAPTDTAPDTVAGDTLAILTDRFTIGEGAKAIRGFDTVGATVTGDVVLSGTGALEVAAPMTLSATRVVALAGARQTLAAEDTLGGAAAYELRLTSAAPAGASVPLDGFAGQMTLRGGSVRVATRIEAPAGRISVQATAGDLTVAAGGRISAAGSTSVFDGEVVTVDAGSISLRSETGVVRVAGADGATPAAVVSVAASGAADAGTVTLAAPGGSVVLDGILDASHATGRGGRLVLDVGTLDGTALATLGGRARDGGFDRGIDVRVRNGDVLVPTGDGAALTAERIAFAVDSGALRIAGRMVATDGAIMAAARDDLEVLGGGRLAAGKGRVFLASSSGTVRLADGATVDLTGGGELHLRAMANTARNDVQARIDAGADILGAGSVTLEGLQRYAATSISTTLITSIGSEAETLMGNSAAIEAAVGGGVTLIAGVEMSSTGNLTLPADWNLSALRPGGRGGVLTLRAAGDLVLAGSLSDGFSTATTTGTLQAGEHWSYRLVAGADAGADPLAVQRGGTSGDVILNAAKLVRTGTGTIDVAAARDVVIGRATTGPNLSTAAIYTAGRPGDTLDGFTPPTGANYPVGGGDLTLSAGRDIRGAVTHQLASEWLQRQGQMTADGLLLASRNPTWWINFSRFQQNTGALGGGDVQVAAGGDIVDLSVVVPTTGRVTGAPNTRPGNDNLVVTGGGDLDVAAGGSLLAGFYYVARGEGRLSAGDVIGAGSRTVGATNPSSRLADRAIAPVLAVGDATMSVRAGLDVDIETVFNPTVLGQDSQVLPTNALTNPRTYFYTYTPRSAVSFRSLAGGVRLDNDIEAIEAALAPITAPAPVAARRSGIVFRTGVSADRDALAVYPGGLRVEALGGGIAIERPMTLYPSAQGDLALLAATDITMNGANVARLVQSDTDASLLANPLYVPVASGTTATNRTVSYANTRERLAGEKSAQARLIHAITPVHLQDGDNGLPVRVVARTGGLDGRWYLAKAASLIAGGDIRNLVLESQNLRDTDTTRIVAGGDISYDTLRNPITGRQENNPGQIVLSGPGLLQVRAGGDIDLGNSFGIVTRGNAANPFLSPQGAGVSVQAGLGGEGNLAAFASRYLDPSTATRGGKPEYRTMLVEWVKEVTGEAPADADAAYARFATLSEIQRRPLIERVLFRELVAAADAASAAAERNVRLYDPGFAAIESLFGEKGATRGNLSLLFSQIKTESGGDIHLFVPGGQVNAGQTTPPAASGSAKDPSDLGIIAQDLGAVRAVVQGLPADANGPAVRGDFAVNESRVFTLRGGEIVIWSSDGNIDAGRGAKTAVSAPPPILITDANGQTVFKFRSASGSGIRSILTDPGIVPGQVSLIAPFGTVDAGDAGIGAAGRIVIASQFVRGADNIQAPGGVTGVAVDNSAALGSTLAGLSGTSTSDTARSSDRAAQSASNAAQAGAGVRTPSFLTVEVLGFGR